MKIETVLQSETEELGTLDYGATFICGGSHYIKTDERDQENYSYWMCVSLADGELNGMKLTEQVEELHGTFRFIAD